MRISKRLFFPSLLMTIPVAVLLGGPAFAAPQYNISGWWWKAQTGSSPVGLPAPPNVPDDGIAVGADPEGDSMVAAIRFTIPSEEKAVTLTLEIFSESGAQQPIEACLGASAWGPVSAGKWSERPSAQCQLGKALGVKSTDGTKLSFLVESLFAIASKDVLDIMLVPGTVSGATGNTKPVFQVAFKKPNASSLVTALKPTPDTQTDLASSAFDGGVAAVTAVEDLQAAPLIPLTDTTPPPDSQTTVRAGLTEQLEKPQAPLSSKILLGLVLMTATVHALLVMMRARSREATG